jgi:hypothetical protein
MQRCTAVYVKKNDSLPLYITITAAVSTITINISTAITTAIYRYTITCHPLTTTVAPGIFVTIHTHRQRAFSGAATSNRPCSSGRLPSSQSKLADLLPSARALLYSSMSRRKFLPRVHVCFSGMRGGRGGGEQRAAGKRGKLQGRTDRLC